MSQLSVYTKGVHKHRLAEWFRKPLLYPLSYRGMLTILSSELGLGLANLFGVDSGLERIELDGL